MLPMNPVLLTIVKSFKYDTSDIFTIVWNRLKFKSWPLHLATIEQYEQEAAICWQV